jgi:hypothetical protein
MNSQEGNSHVVDLAQVVLNGNSFEPHTLFPPKHHTENQTLELPDTKSSHDSKGAGAANSQPAFAAVAAAAHKAGRSKMFNL